MSNVITANKNDSKIADIDKVKAIKKLRQEASKMASMANKRVQRLEKNGLTESPAYKQYIESGGKFGVRGKTYNEVQQELSRLRRFINSQTSTVKGVYSNLKEIAANTGISYENMQDLKVKSAKFFELSSKVEQYLRTVDDMASAVGYQKIWEAINEYTDKAKIDLSDGEADIDTMIKAVTDAIKEYEDPVNANINITATANGKKLGSAVIKNNFFIRLKD